MLLFTLSLIIIFVYLPEKSIDGNVVLAINNSPTFSLLQFRQGNIVNVNCNSFQNGNRPGAG
jgi:hypothetical protein